MSNYGCWWPEGPTQTNGDGNPHSDQFVGPPAPPTGPFWDHGVPPPRPQHPEGYMGQSQQTQYSENPPYAVPFIRPPPGGSTNLPNFAVPPPRGPFVRPPQPTCGFMTGPPRPCGGYSGHLRPPYQLPQAHSPAPPHRSSTFHQSTSGPNITNVASDLNSTAPTTFPTRFPANIPSADLSNIRRQSVLSNGSGRVLSEEPPNEEESWIQQFEKRISQRKTVASKTTQENGIKKLSDVQALAREAWGLLHCLDALRQDMEARQHTATADEWVAMKERAEEAKISFEKVERKLQDENLIKVTQILLRKRRSKRARNKKSKKNKQELKINQKVARQREEESIDAWREKLEKEEKEKRREKAVQIEADSVLGEVRQKLGAATRMRHLLNALSSLRHARLTKGPAHGYVSEPSKDLHFANTVKGIGEVVAAQVKEYKLEEQTLRVMMEASSHHKPQRDEVESAVAKQEATINRVLFGDAPPIDSSLTDQYTAADTSWSILLQRREEWDQYITQEDSPLASSVPVGWVLPPTHPSPDWAPYQCGSRR